MSKRKSNEQTLGAAIEHFLGSKKLIQRYREIGLLRDWESVMGPAIAKHTTEINIRNKILYVRLDSAVLKQELSMAREQLVRKLNEESGHDIINNVKFL
jgi:predicted nucleic acid-binding Zn ribbon protein